MHAGAWEIMLSTHRHLLGGELPGTSVQAVPEVDQKACDTQDPLSPTPAQPAAITQTDAQGSHSDLSSPQSFPRWPGRDSPGNPVLVFLR